MKTSATRGARPTKGVQRRTQHHKNLFVAGMFRQWGYRDVDYDLESNAGPRIEKEPGPEA